MKLKAEGGFGQQTLSPLSLCLMEDIVLKKKKKKMMILVYIEREIE